MSEVRNNWVLISTYKIMVDPGTNFRFMETFLNYYEKEWGIEKFILLVGIPPVSGSLKVAGKRQILERILEWEDARRDDIEVQRSAKVKLPYLNNIVWYKNNKRRRISVDIITYDTNYSTATSEWNHIKNFIFNMINKKLDKKYNKVLNIDNDEFLRYRKCFEWVKEQHFHYVDHVPQKKFDIKKDMKWCLQPWYYRVKWKGHSFAESGLQHGTCKIFWFDRERMINPFEHGGNRPISTACLDASSCSELWTNGTFIGKEIGYHLACLDRKHYVKGKAVNHVESQTEETANMKTAELNKTFKKYYLDTGDYPVFVDNFLKKYWEKGNG